MYDKIKMESRSKGYLVDAIQAVKNKEDSKYFPEGLSLLGVYLDSDFLKTSQVLADPYLAVNLEDDEGITLDIRLKPENKDDPIMKIMDLVLESTSTGMFMSGPKNIDEDNIEMKELRKLSSMLMPKSISGEEIDRLVTLFFTEDSVRLQRFKMLGEEYYAFTLTDTATLGEDKYEHSLKILFKERGSSHETFFSAFVGHKLNKRVTHRLIDSISQTNISGMFIGGTTIEGTTVNSITYGITNTDIELTEGDIIHIRTSDTAITVDMDDINHSKVKVNSAGKYTVVLHLKDSINVHIYIG